jgi:hypothetical protein
MSINGFAVAFATNILICCADLYEDDETMPELLAIVQHTTGSFRHTSGVTLVFISLGIVRCWKRGGIGEEDWKGINHWVRNGILSPFPSIHEVIDT